MTRRFERFACIDWSGAAVATPRGLALACCCGGDDPPELLEPAGGWSRKGLCDWLLNCAAGGDDMLIGVDASFALPFADRGAYLPGLPVRPRDARALWGFVERTCAADPHLGAGTFVDHIEASRHFRRHGGRTGDLFGGGLGRLRETERACRSAGLGSAQSVFNLVGAAQVGKSSLTTMRMLHRLDGRLPIWPFDPVPARGPLLVEIYTTIAARAAGLARTSKIREAAGLARALRSLDSRAPTDLHRVDDHATDAILGAAWLRHAANEPRLWSPSGGAAVAVIEGWTFGVP